MAPFSKKASRNEKPGPPSHTYSPVLQLTFTAPLAGSVVPPGPGRIMPPFGMPSKPSSSMQPIVRSAAWFSISSSTKWSTLVCRGGGVRRRSSAAKRAAASAAGMVWIVFFSRSTSKSRVASASSAVALVTASSASTASIVRSENITTTRLKWAFAKFSPPMLITTCHPHLLFPCASNAAQTKGAVTHHVSAAAVGRGRPLGEEDDDWARELASALRG